MLQQYANSIIKESGKAEERYINDTHLYILIT